MSEAIPNYTNQNVIKTVLEIDLAAYSDIARVLEENLDVQAVRSFQDQIQEFVDHGLKAVSLDRENVVLATAGDNAILVFDSAVVMHDFARAVHQETSRHNASKSIPLAKRWFRMGAATGIVLVIPTERRIVGVTIARAVRLEAAAEKGQLVIDTETYQRLPKEIQDTYGPEEIILGKRTERFRGHRCILTHVPEEADRDIQSPATAPLVPDKPSIAVLPFANMSSDPEQDFFADGIAEDVITALSRYPSLFVIARNSSFTYKGRAVDVKQVGPELGVRYVLEGSVRKAGNRIRVTAQLIEAESGNHVWANRYDYDLADIFALQDEITEAVTTTIAPAIDDAERQRAMRRPPGSLDAWAAYQRGLWHFSKGTADDNNLAEGFFQQAIDLDPSFAGGYTGLAFAQNRAAGVYGKRGLAEIENSVWGLARRAVTLDGNDAEARTCYSEQLMRRGDYKGALAEIQLALTLSPNLAGAYGILGAVLMWSGQPKRGREALEKSIRLDPRNPNLTLRLLDVAISYYLAREYDAAVEAARRGIRSYPDWSNTYRWLAAALGQLGRIEEAQEALAKAIAMAPASFDMFVKRRVPWHRPEDYAHMLEGLRKAGWEG